MKNILLTGGTGFLGSSLLRSLIDANYNVIVLKRSFSNDHRIKEFYPVIKTLDIDLNPLEKIFNEMRIDIILHCATDYGRKINDNLQIVEANLILPLKLLELGYKNGVECFINTDTILDKGVNEYSLSKKQFKDWLIVYSKKMVCLNIALEHFYGPGDDKTKFISFIIDNLNRNVEKIDLTPGEQTRDFIYIDDTVNAFMTIISKYRDGQLGFYDYEVGTGNSYSIRYVVELIKRISGNNTTLLNFGAVSYRENEVMDCTSNNGPVKALGWECKYTLEEGLVKTFEYSKM